MWITHDLHVRSAFVIAFFTLFFSGMATATEYQPEVVFSPIGTGRLSDIAIALDSLNQPHMLFTESLSNGPLPKRLLYAKRVSGQWQVETVATGPLFNGLNGIVIDDSGRPHIAVMDVETRNVMHGVLDAGSWEFDTVALSTSWYTPAIQLDDQNSPLIAYASSINSGRPELAMRSNSGVWTDMPSLVPNSLLYDSGALDLEIDENGVPHISYMGLSGFGQPSFISVVSPDPDMGGALTASRVTAATRDDFKYVTADLEISDDGELRVVSTSTGALGRESHHVLIKGVWEESILSSRGGVITNPAALAIDSLGQSHILHTRIHQNIGSSFLNLLSISPSGIDVELLESHSTGGGSGWLVGMKIDDTDGAHIAYTADKNVGVNYLFIPEPASVTLLAVGGLAVLRRRRYIDPSNARRCCRAKVKREMSGESLMTYKSAVAFFVASFLSVGICGADVIDFAGLSGRNQDIYLGSIEGNYTVTVNTGEWLEAHLSGNPIPDIFGRSAVGSVDVTENTTGLFTFTSVDLDDASSGGFTYTINGFVNAANVLSISGVFPGGQFPTIFSPNSTQVLDTLNIQINSTTSSYNIDNIVVNTVPEPASATLLAVGGLAVLLRR